LRTPGPEAKKGNLCAKRRYRARNSEKTSRTGGRRKKTLSLNAGEGKPKAKSKRKAQGRGPRGRQKKEKKKRNQKLQYSNRWWSKGEKRNKERGGEGQGNVPKQEKNIFAKTTGKFYSRRNKGTGGLREDKGKKKSDG